MPITTYVNARTVVTSLLVTLITAIVGGIFYTVYNMVVINARFSELDRHTQSVQDSAQDVLAYRSKIEVLLGLTEEASKSARTAAEAAGERLSQLNETEATVIRRVAERISTDDFTAKVAALIPQLHSVQTISRTSNDVVTSKEWTDLPEMSLSLISGAYLVQFVAHGVDFYGVKEASNFTVHFRLVKEESDGSELELAKAEYRFSGEYDARAVVLAWAGQLTDGESRIRVQWRSQDGARAQLGHAANPSAVLTAYQITKPLNSSGKE